MCVCVCVCVCVLVDVCLCFSVSGFGSNTIIEKLLVVLKKASVSERHKKKRTTGSTLSVILSSITRKVRSFLQNISTTHEFPSGTALTKHGQVGGNLRTCRCRVCTRTCGGVGGIWRLLTAEPALRARTRPPAAPLSSRVNLSCCHRSAGTCLPGEPQQRHFSCCAGGRDSGEEPWFSSHDPGCVSRAFGILEVPGCTSVLPFTVSGSREGFEWTGNLRRMCGRSMCDKS